MSKKRSKGLYPKWVVTLFATIGLCAIIVFGYFMFKYYYEVATVPTEIDINVVKEKAQHYLDTHGYNKTKIVYLHAYDDEIKTTSMRYYYTSTLSKATRCYIEYIDQDNSNSIWWQRNDGKYDVYFSDSRVDATVKTSATEEPIYMNPWNILNRLEEKYYLLNELGEFEGEKCFVLYNYGTNDGKSSIMGEELYIRASDFAPRAILVYKQYAADDKEKALEDLKDIEKVKEFVSDGVDIEDLKATVEAMEDYTVMYDFTYSTSELLDYDIPQHYIREEDYVELLKSNGLYEEVVDEP